MELKNYINRVLGDNIRCILPSYWWKRIFGLILDKIDEVSKSIGNATPDMSNVQEKLVSGVNIKTVNNESILGSGNIIVKPDVPDVPVVCVIYDDDWISSADQAKNVVAFEKLSNALKTVGSNISVMVCTESGSRIGVSAFNWVKMDETIRLISSLKNVNGNQIYHAEYDLSKDGNCTIKSVYEKYVMSSGATIELAKPGHIYVLNYYDSKSVYTIQDFEQPLGLHAQYTFIFSRAENIILPSYVIWANGDAPTELDPTKHYELKIVGSWWHGEVVYKAVLTSFY